MEKVVLKGGCMCGAIRYSSNQKPKYQTLCHCSDCRQAAGADVVAWVTVDLAHFRFMKEKPAVFQSTPNVIRTFCSICGTTLTYQHEDRSNEVDITTGSLDDPDSFAPNRDVFIKEKLSWVKAISVNN